MTAKKKQPLVKKVNNSKKSASKVAPCAKIPKGKPRSTPPHGNGGKGKHLKGTQSVINSKKILPNVTKPAAPRSPHKPAKSALSINALKSAKSHEVVGKTKKKEMTNGVMKGMVAPSQPARSLPKEHVSGKPTPTSCASPPSSKKAKRVREDAKEEKSAGKRTCLEVEGKEKKKPSLVPTGDVLEKSSLKEVVEPFNEQPQLSEIIAKGQEHLVDRGRDTVNGTLNTSEVGDDIGNQSSLLNVQVAHYTAAVWPFSTCTSGIEDQWASGDNCEKHCTTFSPQDSFSAIAYWLSNGTYGVWFPCDGSCLQILTTMLPQSKTSPGGSCCDPESDSPQDFVLAERCIMYVNPAGHAMVFCLERHCETPLPEALGLHSAQRGLPLSEPTLGSQPPQGSHHDAQWLLLPASLRWKFRVLPWVQRWRCGLLKNKQHLALPGGNYERQNDQAEATATGLEEEALKRQSVVTLLREERWWDLRKLQQGSPYPRSYQVVSFGVRAVFDDGYGKGTAAEGIAFNSHSCVPQGSACPVARSALALQQRQTQKSGKSRSPQEEPSRIESKQPHTSHSAAEGTKGSEKASCMNSERRIESDGQRATPAFKSVPPSQPNSLQEQRWFIPYVCAVKLPSFLSCEGGQNVPTYPHLSSADGAADQDVAEAATPSRSQRSESNVLNSEISKAHYQEEQERRGNERVEGKSFSSEEPFAQFVLANTLERYPGDLFYIHPREWSL